jgi:DNA repair protein RadC
MPVEKYAPIYRIALVKERSGVLTETVNSPDVAARIFTDYLGDVDREHFLLMCLNTRNNVIGLNTVSIGSLDSAVVHPREVFKTAVLTNASSVIVCHNHPGGDPSPSPEDRMVTSRLIEAGKILGIDVQDHIILGDTWLSFRERGLCH